MKKGKRLLIMLLTFLFAMGLFTVVSSAASGDVTETHSGNTYTFTYQSGDIYYDSTYKFAAPDDTYDGNPYDAGVGFTPTESQNNQFYFQEVSTTYNTSGSTAPTDVGKYEVTKTYRVYHGTESSHEGKPVQVTVSDEFEITPKPVRLYWQRNASGGNDFNYEYNAQNQIPVAKVYDAYLISGDLCSVDKVTGAGKNAGDYTATAVSLNNPNYKLDDNDPGLKQSFSITKKKVTVTWKGGNGAIDPPMHSDGFSYYYTGEAQSPEIDSVSGIVEGDDCQVRVNENSKKTDVGTYWAAPEFTGASKDNYEFADPENQKFYIVGASVTVEWGTDKLIYNAEVQHPTATLKYTDPQKTMSPEDSKKVSVTVYSDQGCTQPVTGKTEVGVDKVYYAKASLESVDFSWGEGAPITTSFRIYAKEVVVSLTSEDPITYDAQYHKPDVTIVGVEDGDDCVPVESLTGKTMKTMIGSDGVKTNTVNIPDVNVDSEQGVYHASVDKYIAKVENKNEVEPEESGYNVTTSGLKGTDAHNYKLAETETCRFAIVPLEITLDWFRPAYDEYGDELGSDGVKVDVANGEKLMLVFNGKPQVPTAKIKEELVLTNPETKEPDECEITVTTIGSPTEARDSAYKVADIAFSNPDYTRDQSGVQFYIIPHPVKLEWDKTATTYNGEEQKRTVSITNIQKTDRGKDYSAAEGIGVVEVSEITYTPAYHFGSDGVDTDESKSTYNNETGYVRSDGTVETGLANGSPIDEGRTPTDAGTYVMTAAKLSDPYNYTFVKIDPTEPELKPAKTKNEQGKPITDGFVDYQHVIYTIDQYMITKIDWSNTTVTYNASNQKPVVQVNKSDLQGPDTNKQVDVMFHDNKDSKVDDFAGKCNAGTYDLYVLKNDTFRGIKGDRSMNYFIGDSAQKMDVNFVINKKALTVTVYDKVGYYGDDPATYKHTVKYSGLINGEVNTDDNHQNKNIPGKYKANDGTTKDVVDESGLKFSTNYILYGKPGQYAINASGLTSDNYNIKFVPGTLTINDRMLSGDLVARAKAGNKKGTVYWTGVDGAASYQVYVSLCNKGKKVYTPQLYKTFGANTRSCTIKKLKNKKLKKNTYYKYYVVALDSSGNRIATTETHHFCTNNVSGKYTNPKTIKASTATVSVSRGGTYKLSANVTKVKKKKTLTNGSHTQKVRYRSANNNVATVDANGVVTGVGSGWCRLYVMAANGIWQTVEVNVQ